jgi:hypothetical protein
MKSFHMTVRLSLIFAAVLMNASVESSSAATDEGQDAAARAVLNSAMEAMGGRELLLSLKSLQLDVRETQFRLDDSERNAAPWWASNLKVTETRDLSTERYRIEATVENPQFIYSQSTISDGSVIAIGRTRGGKTGWGSRPEMHERMQLSPERVLFTAESAKDLKNLPDVPIHDVAHHHVRFTWTGFKVDVFINANTHLADHVASLRTNRYDIAQNAWGDVQWSTDYLFWKREPDGLVYPRQSSTLRNGAPILIDSIVGLVENPASENTLFDIPADAQKDFAASGHLMVDDYPLDGPKQISSVATGVWLISGNWNVLVVEQKDGLVVIECPQSAAYSGKLLQFLEQRFPGRKVKALVSTTDSTWHYAGLRTYIARGIPAYALDLNVPLLKSFLAAPHSLVPDEYARARAASHILPVTERTVIGEGQSRLEIYPIRGESDERMLMVYFPELKLLYGSSNDLFTQAQGGSAGTFNLPELVHAAAARRLSIDTYVGIHTAAKPWQDVVQIATGVAALH